MDHYHPGNNSPEITTFDTTNSASALGESFTSPLQSACSTIDCAPLSAFDSMLNSSGDRENYLQLLVAQAHSAYLIERVDILVCAH